MTDRNHCRVVITDECNLSCEFCCMNDKEIHDSFVSSTAMDIARWGYDEICITGGEPLLELPKVIQFASLVRYFNPDVKIYLYTNGTRLRTGHGLALRYAGIDGLNWSIHKINYMSEEYITHTRKEFISYIHKHLIPVRILVGEHEVTQSLKDYAVRNEMNMRIWKMDDCKDMPEEDRYRIDWNRI